MEVESGVCDNQADEATSSSGPQLRPESERLRRREKRVAIHPTLPCSAFSLCGDAFSRAALPRMKRKVHIYRLPFYIGL